LETTSYGKILNAPSRQHNDESKKSNGVIKTHGMDLAFNRDHYHFLSPNTRWGQIVVNLWRREIIQLHFLVHTFKATIMP